ncbi:MAG: hypothetical protein RLZZ74_178, partial [Cyanobacteriota bacterium]
SEQEGGADDDQPDNGVINSIKATVAPGENDKGNDFVEVKLGSLSGSVAQDTDSNGLGDTPLANVELTLLDSKGDVVTKTTTDADGNYSFKDLTPGDYTVVETQPTGFSNVSEQEGGADDDQPNDNILNSIKATVAPGENDKGNDFVEVNQVLGTASPDVLMGTPIGENIAGYKGQDTLTGGGGRDRFIYTETSDGVDIITDFMTGEDQIDLSQIINDELGYTGSDPIADGYVVIAKYGSVGSMIQIDFDAGGELVPKDVVFLEEVSNINPETDLIF